MKAARKVSLLGVYDVGERKPIEMLVSPSGAIRFHPKVEGKRLTTSVERIYFSTLRTAEMNRVRDRERAARRRLVARKETSR